MDILAGSSGNDGAKRARSRSRLLFEVGLALVTAGVVVLLFVAYELVGTNLTEEHSQARLAQEFNRALAAVAPEGRAPLNKVRPATQSSSASAGKATTTRPGAPAHVTKPVASLALPLPPPGGALDHMVIPAIGVDRFVVQGVGEADLQEGPGHYPGTPLPGAHGNVAIAGHRTTFGAPFFRLNELRPGDLIYLTDTSGRTWVYSVERLWVVAPSDVSVLDASHDAELTLTTCNPRFEATTRLVVRAALAADLAEGNQLRLHQLPASLLAARGTAIRPSPRPTAHIRPKLAAAHKVPSPGKAKATSAMSGASSSPRATEGSPTVSAPAAGQRATAQQAGSALGRGSTWVSLELAAWAVLALGGWVMSRVLAARRHGYIGALSLLGGALLCLLPLWFVFENVAVLLPANF